MRGPSTTAGTVGPQRSTATRHGTGRLYRRPGPCAPAAGGAEGTVRGCLGGWSVVTLSLVRWARARPPPPPLPSQRPSPRPPPPSSLCRDPTPQSVRPIAPGLPRPRHSAPRDGAAAVPQHRGGAAGRGPVDGPHPPGRRLPPDHLHVPPRRYAPPAPPPTPGPMGTGTVRFAAGVRDPRRADGTSRSKGRTEGLDSLWGRTSGTPPPPPPRPRTFLTPTVSFFRFVKERMRRRAGGCRPTAGSYRPTVVGWPATAGG